MALAQVGVRLSQTGRASSPSSQTSLQRFRPAVGKEPRVFETQAAGRGRHRRATDWKGGGPESKPAPPRALRPRRNRETSLGSGLSHPKTI